jgi:hypothetical protein
MRDEGRGSISERLAVFAERVPLLSALLSRIDSRTIFAPAVSVGLRFTGHAFLVGLALLWMLSLERLSRALDRVEGFGKFTLLVALLALPAASVYVWALLHQRARRLEAGPMNGVWPIVLQLIGLATEILALVVALLLALKGLFTLVGGGAGADGLEAALWMLATGYERLSELFEPSSEFFSRVGGLLLIAFSVGAGLVILLSGYVFRDLLRAFYNYLRRRDEVD